MTAFAYPLTMLAAWVGARWLSQPMLRLAQCGPQLSNNIHRAMLERHRRCRDAIRVFNQMQARSAANWPSATASWPRCRTTRTPLT